MALLHIVTIFLIIIVGTCSGEKEVFAAEEEILQPHDVNKRHLGSALNHARHDSDKRHLGAALSHFRYRPIGEAERIDNEKRHIGAALKFRKSRYPDGRQQPTSSVKFYGTKSENAVEKPLPYDEDYSDGNGEFDTGFPWNTQQLEEDNNGPIDSYFPASEGQNYVWDPRKEKRHIGAALNFGYRPPSKRFLGSALNVGYRNGHYYDGLLRTGTKRVRRPFWQPVDYDYAKRSLLSDLYWNYGGEETKRNIGSAMKYGHTWLPDYRTTSNGRARRDVGNSAEMENVKQDIETLRQRSTLNGEDVRKSREKRDALGEDTLGMESYAVAQKRHVGSALGLEDGALSVNVVGGVENEEQRHFRPVLYPDEDWNMEIQRIADEKRHIGSALNVRKMENVEGDDEKRHMGSALNAGYMGSARDRRLAKEHTAIDVNKRHLGSARNMGFHPDTSFGGDENMKEEQEKRHLGSAMNAARGRLGVNAYISSPAKKAILEQAEKRFLGTALNVGFRGQNNFNDDDKRFLGAAIRHKMPGQKNFNDDDKRFLGAAIRHRMPGSGTRTN